MYQRVLQQWPRGENLLFSSHFATWDSAHYLFLSEVGYVKGASSCAFYPLWPFMVKWCADIFGVSHLLTGIVLANVLSAIGVMYFHRLMCEKYNHEHAMWATVALLAFPGAMFFFFNYTESLFFCLMMIFFWGWHRERILWVIAASFLLPLTRTVGIFIIIPMAWSVWQERRCMKWIVILVVPLLGWCVYFLWMKIMTGNPLEGFDTQKYWSVNSVYNLVKPLQFIKTLLSPLEFHGYYGSFIDRIWFVLLWCSLYAIWRVDRQWFCWTLMIGIVPAVITHFVSYTRYVTMAFPLFVICGIILHQNFRNIFRYIFIGILAILQVWLLWRHVNFRWAG